ncbi:MAG: hypothetical protein P9L91_06150 [Candidatus Zophobacter franzmannii]|nr:hypothetical protein [Candidatus Zophobacter franzmannii]
MKKKLLNESGSLSIAIVVAIIAVLSSVAMAGIASMDTSSYSMQYDVVQETHFLRSELFRGLKVKKTIGDLVAGVLNFPERRAEVSSSHMRRSYYMKTKIVPKAISNAGDEAVLSGSLVQSLIRGKRGPLTGFLTSSLESKVRKYGEIDLEQMSFAGYHYFTDNESSTNDTPVYFWGNDVIWRRIHSNSDIVIQNGGNNDFNGPWPVFFSKVSTHGHILWENSAGPIDQIFREGYEEEAGELIFNPTADEIRAFGELITPTGDIVLVRSMGAATEAYLGVITLGSVDSLINLVPDSDTWTDHDGTDWPYDLVVDRTAYNLMTHIDTTWTTYSVSCPPGSAVMIDGCELWLEGSFAGAQTWACSDTLSLTGSILLSGTDMGDPPDDPMHMNRSDFVGIVSEKSIVIKYGMPDVIAGPDGNGLYPRLHPNSNDIYIYAAMCALGDGDGNPNYDGVFTFEYMHPHVSSPALDGFSIFDPELGSDPTDADTVFVNVNIPYPDLVGLSYVNGYQPTGYGQILPFNGASTGPGGNSWPADLDYPFYNPLYPEGPNEIAQFAGERGAIILFGSVAQRRRGYVHRSNYNNVNRAQNLWMFDDQEFLGVCQYGSNCPTPGEGYDKDYKFDTRFESIQPPFYPSVHVERGLSPYDAESCRFKKPPTLF